MTSPRTSACRPSAEPGPTLVRSLAVLALLMPAASATESERFSEDFRGGEFDERVLRVIGPPKNLSREADGLRIKVPGDPTAANTGVAFPLQLVGDCAIEADLSLVDVPRPGGGYGTGAALLFEDGVEAGASLQRVRMSDGKDLYIAHHFVKDAAGNYKHDAKSFPATGTEVTLRLQRAGDSLAYLVTEDADEPPRELHRIDFTDRPLPVAQAYAQVGGGPNAVTVLLRGLRVTGDKFLRPGQSPPPRDDRRTWWVAAALFVCLPIAVAALWRFRRRL